MKQADILPVSIIEVDMMHNSWSLIGKYNLTTKDNSYAEALKVSEWIKGKLGDELNLFWLKVRCGNTYAIFNNQPSVDKLKLWDAN